MAGEREHWQQSKYPGYLVSSFGRVLGVKWEEVFGFRLPSGYTYITIPRNRNPRGVQGKVYLHHMVCEAFHGPRPFQGAEVRHLDGDNGNNRSDNLKWGTAAENGRDRVRHGTARYHPRRVR